jgi:uncharacterized protein
MTSHMSVFLLSFISIYSMMHAFFYFRVRVLLPEKWWFHLLLASFLGIMVVAPIFTRLLEMSDHYSMAKICAAIGYTWMGFVFYGFLCFLLVGVLGVSFKLINLLSGSALPLLQGKTTALAVLGLVLAINVYGFFEARCIRTERITIRTPKLPAELDRVRIAQISDIHLGLIVGKERLENILGKVRVENPDILVSTGDLVDGDVGRIDGITAAFDTIKTRFGRYAVTGNHEVFAGLDRSIRAEEGFGFKVLRGSIVNVDGILNIAGVDDPMTGVQTDEKALLSGGRQELFTLFLKHRPEVRPEALGLFDLQLSGHTHYGQLFPFRYFVHMMYPRQNGPYFLDKGSIEYTSRGSGTWGPPIRVLASPEITIIDIVREKA